MATGYARTSIPGSYVSQGASPSASLMYKPRADMTIYGTFADSIQAPDVAAANSGSTIIVNASQAVPPYRSKEGEIGYKLRVRRINFSTALFRIERPLTAIHEGCLIRFRPIMMTTMAALLGAIPVALGWGTGGEARKPLGMAVVGGIAFSQLMTLYLTPVVYTYMAAFMERWRTWRQPLVAGTPAAS